MITITLNMIRNYNPCESGWKKLLNSLGKTTPDDEPLTFSRIAESNGVSDTLWCLRTLEETHKKEKILLVAAIAESVLGIFEKKYPDDNTTRDCITAIKDYAEGKIGRDILLKKRGNAADAAYAAAAYAYAAAYDNVNASIAASSVAVASAAAAYASAAAYAAAYDNVNASVAASSVAVAAAYAADAAYAAAYDNVNASIAASSVAASAAAAAYASAAAYAAAAAERKKQIELIKKFLG